jgi:hypothetical protein
MKRGEPCSASSCNTLERSSAEQTVEVVRNHEDGTGPCGWHRVAEGGGNVSGSGRTESSRRRGTQRSKPMRGTSVETLPETAGIGPMSGASGRSEDEAKAKRDARDFSIESTHPRASACGQCPEDPPVTVKVEGEGGEGQRAATARDGRHRLLSSTAIRRGRDDGTDRRSLKVPSTSRAGPGRRVACHLRIGNRRRNENL